MFENPYFQYGNMRQSMPAQQIIKVNGINGANAYQMPPNSSALLLDEKEALIYVKTTDGAGYPSISAFQLVPYDPKAEETKEFDEIKMRLKRLEDLLNESYIKPDATKAGAE